MDKQTQMTTIDKIIDRVLYDNNKHWLSPEQAEWNIAEGRVPITRQDVHDIIKKLPIKIAYGENLHVEITDEGVIIKENKESMASILRSQAQDLIEEQFSEEEFYNILRDAYETLPEISFTCKKRLQEIIDKLAKAQTYMK